MDALLAVKVVNKIDEALDIVSFELAALDGQTLPSFGAGAHIDVHIRAGLVRQYSLCNDPGELQPASQPAPQYSSQRYLIGVLRDANSRGGSVAMHEQIQLGDILQISPPRNHFALVPAKRTLLFAGGIGVTPILCMAERLAHTGADFEMHYCTRSIERTAFRARIIASSFASQVQFHVDTEASGFDLPALLASPNLETHLYVCGPGAYIDYVLSTAKRLGWAAEQLHCEYFGAAANASDASEDGPFEIQIASSGKLYTVPADQTITNCLAEHGIDIPVSCEQGVCGTCITRVLQGTPAHRDLYFTEEEQACNDQFTPCCSRSKSALLVLDL